MFDIRTLEKASKSIARSHLAISYGRLHADTYPLAGGHLTLSTEETYLYALLLLMCDNRRT